MCIGGVTCCLRPAIVMREEEGEEGKGAGEEVGERKGGVTAGDQ